MKVSFGLTVCDEHDEFRALVSHLVARIDAEDEIVVVYDQNRVTPEVLAVLREFDAHLAAHPFPFRQDFLENKNFLGDQCSGDYIFQLDADEIPSEDLLRELKSFLRSNPVDVLLVPRRNLVAGLTPAHVQRWGWRVNEHGWVNWPDAQRRVYRNTPEIKWTGHRVHGMVSGHRSEAALPMELRFSILHDKTIGRQEGQNDRYDRIGRGELT